jgi:hypothetical protein
VADLLSPEAIDRLVADAQDSGMGIDGAGGLLQRMMKAVLERALQAELTDHLGYEQGDPAGRGSGNHRNGSCPKTVQTTTGPVTVEVSAGTRTSAGGRSAAGTAGMGRFAVCCWARHWSTSPRSRSPPGAVSPRGGTGAAWRVER